MPLPLQDGRPGRLAPATFTDEQRHAAVDLYSAGMQHQLALLGKHAGKHLIDKQVFERGGIESANRSHTQRAAVIGDQEIGKIGYAQQPPIAIPCKRKTYRAGL